MNARHLCGEFTAAIFSDSVLVYYVFSPWKAVLQGLYTLFTPNNPGELSVPEGGVIRVTQYINNHWLEASYQGETGLFPVSYAERLKNEPQLQNFLSTMPAYDEEPQENLLSNWQSQNNEFSSRQNNLVAKPSSSDGSFVKTAFAFCARNDSELTFPSGALIEVTSDVDDDWLEGSFNGRTGLFPKSYVRSSERPCARAVYPFVGESLGELTFREDFSFMDPSPKDGGGQNNAIASKIQWKRGMKGKALFHFTALYSGDLELNEGDVVTVLEVDDDNWIEGQLSNGICGSCPAAYLEPVYDIRKHFENKPLKRRTQGFSSDRSFSGIFGDVVSDTGYTNAPQIGGSGQRTSEFVNSYVNRDDDTSIYKSLLDSSFTMDLTPSLLPSNTPATAQETVQRTKPLLKPKPALGTKPTQNYSVTYLGSEDRLELSALNVTKPP
ncbi:hypothetical protein OS493_038229 [Desmophyllum pertusum]|uniref:SH3 domain-containing protein n=1 Tax=Desmophyllum pertusum TaxID=174260 RepID=A0A9W9ZWC4_9CNID|nr:hypothetical protein OS493_038229 [Desmophyllum pertusum]